MQSLLQLDHVKLEVGGGGGLRWVGGGGGVGWGGGGGKGIFKLQVKAGIRVFYFHYKNIILKDCKKTCSTSFSFSRGFNLNTASN